eukprot:Skav224056  [mRNA]  locus=scaffold534:436788:437924:- [translate_table: standard]
MQPPGPSHKIQGVIMSTTPSSFTLAPDTDRLQRMVSRLREVLLDNKLSRDEASKIAGKLQFMTDTLAGQALKACLGPLYHHSYHGDDHKTLPTGLRDAMQTTIFILDNLQPKIYQFNYTAPAILYADAYFQAGDLKLKLSQAWDSDWDTTAVNLYQNGWGWVLHLPDGRTLYANGQIPSEVVKHLTTKSAYIYGLEIIAQVLPLIVCRTMLSKSQSLWCWIDNEAGKAALRKGFGRDVKINRLLCSVWTYLTTANLDPHWRRVCSQANISDPISRDDLEIALKHQWLRVEADWDQLYRLLLLSTTNMEQALRCAHKYMHFTGRILARNHGAAPSRATMVGSDLLDLTQAATSCSTSDQNSAAESERRDAEVSRSWNVL